MIHWGLESWWVQFSQPEVSITPRPCSYMVLLFPNLETKKSQPLLIPYAECTHRLNLQAALKELDAVGRQLWIRCCHASNVMAYSPHQIPQKTWDTADEILTVPLSPGFGLNIGEGIAAVLSILVDLGIWARVYFSPILQSMGPNGLGCGNTIVLHCAYKLLCPRETGLVVLECILECSGSIHFGGP